MPYMDARFLLQDTAIRVPTDYGSLRIDVYFGNHMINRLPRLQRSILPNYQRTTRVISGFTGAIDAELDVEA